MNANLVPFIPGDILLAEYFAPLPANEVSTATSDVSVTRRSGEAVVMATFARTIREFKEDKLQHWAAALTYYAVLSLFPALLVMVSLVGLLADPETVTKFLTDVIGALGPASAVDTFKGPIESVTSNRGAAGVLAIVGVAAALWSASGYVSAFTEAANSIYEVDEGRPFWKLKPLQLLVTLVCIVLVAITALALVVSGPLAEAIGAALG